MDYTFFLVFLSFFLTLIYVFTISGRRGSRLPPGPYCLPIIGNLLKLGDLPHRSLTKLSKRYGPLMSLRLGCRTVIVVSSPDIAKEFFLTHDQSFSSRSVSETVRYVDHANYSIIWLPAENKWRKLRKIAKEYLFSAQHMDVSKFLREKKVGELVEYVHESCRNEKAINISQAMFTASLNVLSNFIFSMDMSQYGSMTSQELKDVVWELMVVSGKPNLIDFFPILKPLDPQGLMQHADVHFSKLMILFDNIINQRKQTRSSGDVSSTKNDVLDLLLNLEQQGESALSQKDMKNLFADIFIAGTDATSSTLEWAMTELINSPQKMDIARSELVKHMKGDYRNIQEQDMAQLPYLQAVIKETLRLHPPVSFLIPHEAIRDVEVCGFTVPKNAQILCNLWAMGRDPNIWSDPETFMPERFLDTQTEFKGHDYKFIPFGTGRRMCMGMDVAHRMLHLVLGSLIFKFDWKIEGNMNVEEKFGLTVQRKVPLMVLPVKL